jgi:hypothetical protein
MNLCRTLLSSAAIALALGSFAVAQNGSPDRTPSETASAPQQTQVPGGSRADHTDKTEAKQTMKACVIREQADHTGMSLSDARKSCKEQLKVTPHH